MLGKLLCNRLREYVQKKSLRLFIRNLKVAGPFVNGYLKLPLVLRHHLNLKPVRPLHCPSQIENLEHIKENRHVNRSDRANRKSGSKKLKDRSAKDSEKHVKKKHEIHLP